MNVFGLSNIVVTLTELKKNVLSLAVVALFVSVVVGCGNDASISGGGQRAGADQTGSAGTGTGTGQQLGSTATPGSTGYVPYRPGGTSGSLQPIPILPVQPVQPGVDPGIAVVVPGSGVQPGTGTLPANNTDLAASGVWDQGDTMWCWAFSAYHALRAYYAATPLTDAATVAWKGAIAQLNNQSAFESFVAREYDRSTGGDPIMLVEMIQQQFSLPAQNWVDTYSDVSSPSQLMSDVRNNLGRGIPSVFCDGGHCVAVLGTSGADEFTIGDSSGGDIYPRSTSSLEGDLDCVMVLRN